MLLLYTHAAYAGSYNDMQCTTIAYNDMHYIHTMTCICWHVQHYTMHVISSSSSVQCLISQDTPGELAGPEPAAAAGPEAALKLPSVLYTKCLVCVIVLCSRCASVIVLCIPGA